MYDAVSNGIHFQAERVNLFNFLIVAFQSGCEKGSVSTADPSDHFRSNSTIIVKCTTT